jgi:hypothetical protein
MYYRRLEEDGQFLTLVTSLDPGSQKSRVLHYNVSLQYPVVGESRLMVTTLSKTALSQ